MTGAPMEIWSARVPSTRARSYFVMYRAVMRFTFGLGRDRRAGASAHEWNKQRGHRRARRREGRQREHGQNAEYNRQAPAKSACRRECRLCSRQTTQRREARRPPLTATTTWSPPRRFPTQGTQALPSQCKRTACRYFQTRGPPPPRVQAHHRRCRRQPRPGQSRRRQRPPHSSPHHSWCRQKDTAGSIPKGLSRKSSATGGEGGRWRGTSLDVAFDGAAASVAEPGKEVDDALRAEPNSTRRRH